MRATPLLVLAVAACSSPAAPPAPPPSATSSAVASAPPPAAAPPPPVDAGSPQPEPREDACAGATEAVKVATIGMHVAGGPFDEPTKVPFKTAVEPHFAELACCWAKHVPHPPKSADVGVDLLIEGAGGTPKVSNPRSTLPGGGKAIAEETAAFVPCVMHVFEGVTFPNLGPRGRTGVSYSLRFTPR